ncbi:MAG: phosphate signaling complex protein PhoU [Chloroflexota bacterium]|nr:phosphate signaling complex protein PhoU [Chloroflexota bacterium]
MARASFDIHLHHLLDDLLLLGGMVEKAIATSLQALKDRDLATSERVIKEDDFVDQKRWELEDRCLELIATQQPMAVDLRVLVTILHISVELERMGDYAEGIAKISLMMGDEPPLKPLVDIPLMADKATDMLNRSLDALLRRDIEEAVDVCNKDDEVDHLYEVVYRDLLDLMIKDPANVQRATYLLWVAHDLERIADRATNIAERVVFMVTGKMNELNVSKY